MQTAKTTADFLKSMEVTTIAVSPRDILRFAAWFAIILLVMNGGVLMSRVLTGHGHLLGFGPMFYVGQEANVPTWFSSMLLLACSALLWFIAQSSRQRRDGRHRYWRVLSVLFFVMSVDEAATIHETIGTVFERASGMDFFKTYGFLAPGAVIVFVVALSFLRFVLSLPRDTRNLFLAAGILYATGASAMESVSLNWAAHHSPVFPVYSVLVTGEEIFEMSGVIVFLYALASYVSKHMSDFRISIMTPNPLERRRS